MILGIVAVLGLTTPARHDPIAWPLPFRFTWQMAECLPGVWLRVAIGGQLAILGLVTALVALVLRRRWWRPAFVGGVATVGLGLAAALPPLVVDAYPTTYVRPTVAYTAASIARGHALYREHCASCHGVGGAGDGPAAASAIRRPADLIGRRTADRTAGDLFWWLTHGAPGLPLHGFGNRLSPEQRWDAVNFLRTLAAAEQARGLGLRASDRPTIVAPDVSYTTGVGAERSLREYRRSVVLLVLFRVPESFERLSRLGRRHFDFRLIGAEIVGVPVHGARTLYRALGGSARTLPARDRRRRAGHGRVWAVSPGSLARGPAAGPRNSGSHGVAHRPSGLSTRALDTVSLRGCTRRMERHRRVAQRDRAPRRGTRGGSHSRRARSLRLRCDSGVRSSSWAWR